MAEPVCGAFYRYRKGQFSHYLRGGSVAGQTPGAPATQFGFFALGRQVRRFSPSRFRFFLRWAGLGEARGVTAGKAETRRGVCSFLRIPFCSLSAFCTFDWPQIAGGCRLIWRACPSGKLELISDDGSFARTACGSPRNGIPGRGKQAQSKPLLWPPNFFA